MKIHIYVIFNKYAYNLVSYTCFFMFSKKWLKHFVIFLRCRNGEKWQFNLQFSVEKNAVAYKKINIFYMISLDNVTMWISLYATAVDIVFYFYSKGKNYCRLLIFKKNTVNCTVYDVTTSLVKVLLDNHIYSLFVGIFCLKKVTFI